MLSLRSELRNRLLSYYFTNPKAIHYLRELAGLLEADPANLSRELARLERAGLFLGEHRGRQKYFRLSPAHPLYAELRSIVLKTVGAVEQLRKALAGIRGIQESYLYGSFARDQQDAASDIDVLIVGRPDASQLELAIRALERRLGREINYTLFGPEEFRSRLAGRDAFLEKVWQDKKICLVEPIAE